ncbi:hypothetical protein AEGHOMDF_0285 [Methylobacterium soli]|nr:hypothetical protein AEGHOMDF_0285 [Methylobacterium soli]
MILRFTLTAQNEICEIDLRGLIAHLRRPPEPMSCYVGIDINARPDKMQLAQRSRRSGVSQFRRALEPRDSFHIVGREVTTLRMEKANQRRRVCVAPQPSSAQPGLAENDIPLDAFPIQQR